MCTVPAVQCEIWRIRKPIWNSYEFRTNELFTFAVLLYTFVFVCFRKNTNHWTHPENIQTVGRLTALSESWKLSENDCTLYAQEHENAETCNLKLTDFFSLDDCEVVQRSASFSTYTGDGQIGASHLFTSKTKYRYSTNVVWLVLRIHTIRRASLQSRFT